MVKWLIVNADDYGYSPGVSHGILRAHRDGIVTSTTVLVNTPYAAEAIRLAQQTAPRLGLGVHLTLTSGRPITDPALIPDLVDSRGMFRPRSECLPQLGKIDAQQAERELRAQIRCFQALAGHPPDHFDSHHHTTYLAPAVAQSMLELADELNVPVRRPTLHNEQASAASIIQMGAASTLEEATAVTAHLNRVLAAAHTPMPDHFFPSFYGENATLGDLLNLLMSLPDGVSELMCHPAEVDEALRVSSYVEGRARELAALTHPAAREVIEAEGIELINFGDLQ